jgi:methionyl-tRNA synthetase
MKFYLTTPIYYVNDRPHIGTAYTTIAADVVARFKRLEGYEVMFVTGTDDNSEKNAISAKKEGISTQEYVDKMSALFQQTWDSLGLSFDRFIRTTEERHHRAVYEFWRRVEEKGDIYRGTYQGLYCLGCEAYLSEGDLVDGKCPLHNKEPQKLSEENYFFRLSKYKDTLLAHIEAHSEFIQPISRRNEIIAYIKEHLEDISISRKNREWGIRVPTVANRKSQIANSLNDKRLAISDSPSQEVIYVWFDALINYLSVINFDCHPDPPAGGEELALSLPKGSLKATFPPKADPPLAERDSSSANRRTQNDSGGDNFSKYWPADLHLMAKDIIKFHCALWPAMLLSAGLPLPRKVFAHGYLTINGQKMSKTLGNVLNPIDLAQRYGLDTLRYFLMREITFGEDGDFSETRLKERYQGDLANGLGNLTARVLTMAEKYCEGRVPEEGSTLLDRVEPSKEIWLQWQAHLENLAFDKALTAIWEFITCLDVMINEEKPWEMAKTAPEKLPATLYTLLEGLRHIGVMLIPFMPETSEKIFLQLGVMEETKKTPLAQLKQWGGLKPGTKIKKTDNLFPRLN